MNARPSPHSIFHGFYLSKTQRDVIQRLLHRGRMANAGLCAAKEARGAFVRCKIPAGCFVTLEQAVTTPGYGLLEFVRFLNRQRSAIFKQNHLSLKSVDNEIKFVAVNLVVVRCVGRVGYCPTHSEHDIANPIGPLLYIHESLAAFLLIVKHL